MPGVPKFGDIAKSGSSLLNDDYKYDGKCEVKTKLENGVAIKSTFTRAEKDGNIGAVLEMKRTIAVLDFTARVDHKGMSNMTVENGTLLPGLKLKGEGALNGSTSKVAADYKHDLFTASASVDTVKSVAALNGVMGFKNVAVGVSSAYTYKGKTGWSTPALSGQYTGGNYEVGVSVEKLGDKLGLTYHQKVSKELSGALLLEQETVPKGGGKMTSLNLVLGGNLVLDKDSSVKAKVDSSGVVSAAYSQKIRPQMTLKLTGEINTAKLSASNAHKIGITCLMDY
eukprot:CAMPEP_0206241546 /NCGR_PEP_ID=MMETSP0047_2-20121206/16550_1 /ASSEMBLY_ACC=CAM_ASM_000192 /TAXON_ID=195065 /ORGANISM="Chroomonas mesostigmatica_cf, Strain CCMP1168" /LENGTH=282 /DNA_ID=CAMNT_0053666443 /DNA_START=27 /DNA_END=875 /DNA_ORIENTATION=-